jgi:Ca2+-binding RTX toxin-like protein
MFEVIESSLPYVMAGSPPASDAAQARINGALGAPHRLRPEPRRSSHPERARRISGRAGNDNLHGHLGPDVINGQMGDDQIDGRGGDDSLRGGRGADRLFGAEGNDWLSGDRDNDTLTGGSGADRFHIASGFGDDLVTDFNAAEGDRVEMPRGAAYTLRDVGTDVVVELSGARLSLRGIRMAELPADWLVFR